MQSALSAYIELVELHIPDTITLPTGYTRDFYFCNTGEVSFNKSGVMQVYSAFPVQLTGIAQTSAGAPPRPKLTIATIDPLISNLAFSFNDIVGTKVVYIRTFEEYLTSGASSFPLHMEIYRLEGHNKHGMIFELRFSTDRETDYFPKKQMLRNEFPGMGVNSKAT